MRLEVTGGNAGPRAGSRARRGLGKSEEGQSDQNMRRFRDKDLRDLQVWFNLSWCGFAVRKKYSELGELIQKGRDFTEEEKQRVLEIHQEMLRGILGEYRALADSGQVELTTTPFYHPILPLLVDTDIAKRAIAGVGLLFLIPHGTRRRKRRCR